MVRIDDVVTHLEIASEVLENETVGSGLAGFN
jgi:hypothetical protein